MAKIFISYRRDDSRAYTGRIYDRLVERFGTDAIFRDIDSLPLGKPFPMVLDETIEKTDVVLALIGPSWLSITDENGTRRIDNPGDFVRLEIERALLHGKPLIPVTIETATIPQPSDMPLSIRQLSIQNGMAVRADPDFHRDIESLIAKLEELMGVSSRSAQPRCYSCSAPATTRCTKCGRPCCAEHITLYKDKSGYDVVNSLVCQNCKSNAVRIGPLMFGVAVGISIGFACLLLVMLDSCKF